VLGVRGEIIVYITHSLVVERSYSFVSTYGRSEKPLWVSCKNKLRCKLAIFMAIFAIYPVLKGQQFHPLSNFNSLSDDLNK